MHAREQWAGGHLRHSTTLQRSQQWQTRGLVPQNADEQRGSRPSTADTRLSAGKLSASVMGYMLDSRPRPSS